MGGKGRGKATKGICCFGSEVVIWKFSCFLLPNKTEWALFYSPEALSLYSILNDIGFFLDILF